MDQPSCVVLVPVAERIEPECDDALSALEDRGYEVRRVRGYAAIDQARSQMATDALADGFDELLWVDSDVGFHPDSVERLRSHGLPFVCGIYPKKGEGARALACHLLPATEVVEFGPGGGILEILYAAAGFTLVARRVYEDVRRACDLPECNQRFGRITVPYYLPMLVGAGEPEGPWYLGEDFAFSERARLAGHTIHADTTLRLLHIGRYAFSWEDAGGQIERRPRYRFQITK